MQQCEKGYSVLECVPEEKVPLQTEENVKDAALLRQHGRTAIAWYCFIFALIASLVFVWAYVLSQLQYSELTSTGHDGCNNILHLEGGEDYFEDGQRNPADVLEMLQQNDTIQGESWNAWTTIVSTPARHICRIDDGVGNTGADFVLKRYDIVHALQMYPPMVTLVQRITTPPNGYNLTGLVVIEDWRDAGNKADCALRRNNQTGEITVIMMSEEYRGLHFVILAIGRKETKEERGRDEKNLLVDDVDKINSDEFFKDYVY